MEIRATKVYLPSSTSGIAVATIAPATATVRVPSVTVSAGTPNLVNVLSFGATGNGTTDDTAAVQAAANASVGKTLYFPGGKTYSIFSVNVPNGTVGVTGDGPTSLLKQRTLASFSDTRPTMDVKNNIRVSNIKIDGNRVANKPDAWADTYCTNGGVGFTNSSNGRGRGYRSGIRVEFVHDVVIDSVEITACAGAAVGCFQTRAVTVNNCNIHDTDWEAVIFYGGGIGGRGQITDQVITNNTCLNIYSPPEADAQGINPDCFIMSLPLGNNRCDGNTLHGCDRNLVKIESGVNVSVANNFCKAVVSHAPGFGGIHLQNADTNKSWVNQNIRITGNQVEGPGWQQGIESNGDLTLANVDKDIEIDHNTILSFTSGGSPGSGTGHLLFGLQIDGSVSNNNFNIHDNDIWNTATYAIYYRGGGTGLFLTNNKHNGVTMANESYPGTSPSGLFGRN